MPAHRSLSRWKAAGIHLCISVAIAILVGSLIYFVWYPTPYFQVAGGSKLMLLVMAVDVVIGPLLTVVVFKSGKKGLRFDLAVISTLQVAAFAYGIFVITSARPVFIVAVVDRFTPVYAIDLSDADLAEASRPEFSIRSWTGPVMVAALQPDATKNADIFFSAMNGKDLEKMPKFYVPYLEGADALLARAKPLSALSKQHPESSRDIDKFATDRGLDITGLVYVPLVGRTESYTMVLSTESKLPVGVLSINPW